MKYIDDALTTLERLFHGFFKLLSPYSPDFNPIELGFANVKGYIKMHEYEAVANPIAALNAAFELYSVRGEKSYVAFNNWKSYFNNHSIYLEQFN